MCRLMQRDGEHERHERLDDQNDVRVGNHLASLVVVTFLGFFFSLFFFCCLSAMLCLLTVAYRASTSGCHSRLRCSHYSWRGSAAFRQISISSRAYRLA